MTTLRARVLDPESPEAVRWLDDAVVRLDGGAIAEVAPWDGRPVDEDLRPWVLLPGFVDAHLHFPQTRIVGSASGPLLDWLDRSTFPEEGRFADPAHAAAVAERFCRRLASSGTTFAMAYGSVHPTAAEVLFSALDAAGLRAIAGPVLMDEHCPEALQLPAKEALPALADLADRWHGHDGGRLQVAAIPRFALCCSRELMAGAGALAAERGLWVTTHLSENPVECRIAVERFGTKDYLEVYEQVGLVHDRTVMAHCIHLSGDEWDRMAAARAVVAHCPDSNDFLGSGGMPVAAVRARGIRCAIGTDIAAGRSFRVPRILSSAYDNGLRQGVSFTPAELLWWGTRGGARALGREDLGRVAEGFRADLCAFAPPEWAADADAVLSALIFDHDAPPMSRTWVEGRVVWDAG